VAGFNGSIRPTSLARVLRALSVEGNELVDFGAGSYKNVRFRSMLGFFVAGRNSIIRLYAGERAQRPPPPPPSLAVVPLSRSPARRPRWPPADAAEPFSPPGLARGAEVLLCYAAPPASALTPPWPAGRTGLSTGRCCAAPPSLDCLPAAAAAATTGGSTVRGNPPVSAGPAAVEVIEAERIEGGISNRRLVTWLRRCGEVPAIKGCIAGTFA
jgi:hypothetical protein